MVEKLFYSFTDEKTMFVFSSSNIMARKNVTLKRMMMEIRNHPVCPLVVHMAEASSPLD